MTKVFLSQPLQLWQFFSLPPDLTDRVPTVKPAFLDSSSERRPSASAPRFSPFLFEGPARDSALWPFPFPVYSPTGPYAHLPYRPLYRASFIYSYGPSVYAGCPSPCTSSWPHLYLPPLCGRLHPIIHDCTLQEPLSKATYCVFPPPARYLRNPFRSP